MTHFSGFYSPQIGGRVSCWPKFAQKYQEPCIVAHSRVLLPALGWSCRTVLHTSVPAYRHKKTMKLGLVPKRPKETFFLNPTPPK